MCCSWCVVCRAAGCFIRRGFCLFFFVLCCAGFVCVVGCLVLVVRVCCFYFFLLFVVFGRWFLGWCGCGCVVWVLFVFFLVFVLGFVSYLDGVACVASPCWVFCIKFSGWSGVVFFCLVCEVLCVVGELFSCLLI